MPPSPAPAELPRRRELALLLTLAAIQFTTSSTS